MLAYLVRTAAGPLLSFLMSAGMRILFAQRASRNRTASSAATQEPPVPSAPNRRIHINPADIVDGDFKPIPGQEKE